MVFINFTADYSVLRYNAANNLPLWESDSGACLGRVSKLLRPVTTDLEECPYYSIANRPWLTARSLWVEAG